MGKTKSEEREEGVNRQALIARYWLQFNFQLHLLHSFENNIAAGYKPHETILVQSQRLRTARTVRDFIQVQ